MAEVESVSPVPSTSNLLNPLIPTTITAEIRVEPQQQSSSTSSSAATATTNTSSNALIVAPSHNNNNSSNNQENQENTADTDEPEPKRKKLDTKPKLSSKLVEKLEARLGGILCCAVCLDLPRTAMYQVIEYVYFPFVVPSIT